MSHIKRWLFFPRYVLEQVSLDDRVVIPDINSVQLPLQRETGTSYLINAALGKERRGVLSFHMNGLVGTFVSLKENSCPLDEIIQEAVYLFKIDVVHGVGRDGSPWNSKLVLQSRGAAADDL
jgi:hypothetical protein